MKYIPTLLLFIILLGCTNSSSQKDLEKSNVTLEPIFKMPKDAIPFQFDGRHIIVQATMNDSVEISLILDTGAQFPFFDSTFITKNENKLKIIKKPANYKLQTMNGMISINSRIGGKIRLKVFNETFTEDGALMIADLRHVVFGADAVIPAYTYFENKIVLIDLQHQYLRILSQDTLNNLKKKFLSFPMLGNQFSYFTVASDLDMVINKTMNIKTKGELIIDLGAPGLLYLFKNHKSVGSAIPAQLKPLKVKYAPFQGNDTTIQDQIFTDNLSLLNAFNFQNARVVLSAHNDQSLNHANRIGLLGNEFLRKFIVIIDYKNKQLYLRPGPEYFKPCKNANFGMTLYKDLDGKAYIVTGIYVKSSPANAGIQLNDKILAINERLTEKMSYKEIDSIRFSPVGTKLVLKIKRGQQVFNREILIQSLW